MCISLLPLNALECLLQEKKMLLLVLGEKLELTFYALMMHSEATGGCMWPLWASGDDT